MYHSLPRQAASQEMLPQPWRRNRVLFLAGYQVVLARRGVLEGGEATITISASLTVLAGVVLPPCDASPPVCWYRCPASAFIPLHLKRVDPVTILSILNTPVSLQSRVLWDSMFHH